MRTLIVVSGGDAPGINAVIHHVVRLAETRGDEVFGAIGGLAGVLRQEMRRLTGRETSVWQAAAGSLLPSSREVVLSPPDARERLLHVLAQAGIDQMLLLGGDGTLRHVLPAIHSWGINCIGLPVTIDNDVPGTERTLGFDSACNFAYAALDGIRSTAHALPGRIFTLETLGGSTGFLALAVAYASGADAVLIPEYTFDLDWLAGRTCQAVNQRGYALIILSEGVSAKDTLAQELTRRTGIRVRDTRLGHAQRGGAPSHIDRLLAADMARTAFEASVNGRARGVVVISQGRAILRLGSLQGLDTPMPDPELYAWINGKTG